jgi:iron complex transport system substrate-binding protein
MRHRLLSLTAAAMGVVALTACGSEDVASGGAAGYPLTVTNCAREVTIEKPPERIYVIGGEAGTLVHAAGGSDRISTFSPLQDEPLGVAAEALGAAPQLPIVGSKDISREVIIGAEPDLVVTYGLNEFTPEDLEASGIPTLVISGYCGGFGAGQSTVEDPLEGIYADITTLGRVLGTEDQSAQAVKGLRNRVTAVQQRAAPDVGAAAAVFVVDPESALGAYGRRSMIHQQMEYVGLSNVFADTDERYFEPNSEALINARPDVLVGLYQERDVSSQGVLDTLASRPELGSIPAIAEKNILVLDFFYSGHGTLAVDGLEQLAGQLAEQR